jgi:hypothetical protein
MQLMLGSILLPIRRPRRLALVSLIRWSTLQRPTGSRRATETRPVADPEFSNRVAYSDCHPGHPNLRARVLPAACLLPLRVPPAPRP